MYFRIGRYVYYEAPNAIGLTMAEEIAFTAGMKQYRSELRKRAEQKKDMPEGYSFEIGV